MIFFKKHIDPGSSDEDLMKLIQQGQKAAFELLYTRYFEKLVWYANGFVQDMHSAEDIVQEVFVKVIEVPDRFDTERKFSTWIYTVTGNLARNHLRNSLQHKKWVLKKQFEPALQSVKPHHRADSRHLEERLQHIFSNLTEKEQLIFTLRFEQQCSIKEIAGQLDIPEGSVKSGIFYLLKKYNHLMQHFIYEN